jgi:putative ABC transport system permease protein
MWNKKGSHTLLIVEILASFLVLFGVTSLIVYNLDNYRQPLGFDYKNVWVITMNRNDTPDSVAVPVMDQVKARMRGYPEVASVTFFGFNTPYSMNTAGGGVSNGTADAQIDHFHTDLDMARTLNVPVAEGRWFDRSDEAPNARTVVINRALAKALFGDEPALGKAHLLRRVRRQAERGRVLPDRGAGGKFQVVRRVLRAPARRVSTG